MLQANSLARINVCCCSGGSAAGGISITPAFTVLQQLAAAAAGGATPQLPILLLWSFRHAVELELLCPPLLALAATLRLQLTTRLFYTGEPSPTYFRQTYCHGCSTAAAYAADTRSTAGKDSANAVA
jgi:hypothetical protein